VIYRLTVTEPGRNPVTYGPTILVSVSAYRAMVVLMNADLAFQVSPPVPYLRAREFAEGLARAPMRWQMTHRPTGLVFSIHGEE
jgi:hypothetical protein